MKFFLSKKVLKIFSINVFILFVFLIIPPTLLLSFRTFRGIFISYTDKRSDLPAYKDNNFAKQLLNEMNRTRQEYKPYVVWRRRPFKSEYTNIGGRYQTRSSTGDGIENSTWFFGGSTMWGTGSSDKGTIPSIYNQLTNKNVKNLGESSWVSRQSLNQLLNLLGDGYKPSEVVFYSGHNDIGGGCRTEIDILPSHVRSLKISRLIKGESNFLGYLSYINFKLLEPYRVIIRKTNLHELFKKTSYNHSFYNCHNNNNKAESVARHLVNNWHAAYLLSRLNNARFYAVLQPNIYSSDSDFKYLNKDELKRKQYDVLFPLIIKEVQNKCLLDKNFCNSFIDGRKWIDRDSKVFIDDCHLTEEGNLMVVENFIKAIK